MATFKDITGLRFGRWVVLRQGENWKIRFRRWECQCDCGTRKLNYECHLLSGRSKSCGCGRITHGNTRPITAEYYSWSAAKNRCTNPKHHAYNYYGGRGITMCPRWANSFADFLTDMGKRPPGTSLDRFPNNDGNYEPGNCRWATPKEQCGNRALPGERA